MHDVDPVLTDFKATMEKVDAQLAKFEELCQQQKNVRKTIFYRAKHALGHVERQKLHIQQLLRRFVNVFFFVLNSFFYIMLSYHHHQLFVYIFLPSAGL